MERTGRKTGSFFVDSYGLPWGWEEDHLTSQMDTNKTKGLGNDKSIPSRENTVCKGPGGIYREQDQSVQLPIVPHGVDNWEEEG